MRRIAHTALPFGNQESYAQVCKTHTQAHVHSQPDVHFLPELHADYMGPQNFGWIQLSLSSSEYVVVKTCMGLCGPFS